MTGQDDQIIQPESLEDIAKRIRYCIVDNDTTTGSILYDYLLNKGIKNITLTSWNDAISVIADQSPDVLLAGIIQPANEGLEILRPLLASGDTRNEIILITDYTETMLSIEALRLGVSDILTKPICPDDLDNALSKVTKRLAHKIRQQQYFRKIHAALEQSNGLDADAQQVSSLLRGTIHNLNGPLSVISGNAQLLEIGVDGIIECITKHKKDLPVPLFAEILKKLQNNRDIVSNILCSTDKMKDMICGLLARWSKEADTETREFSLREFLELELSYLNTNLFFKNKVGLVRDFADNLPNIKGVYSDFSQTFQNLVNNALDAMHDSPVRKLTVCARYDDDCACIEIQDTGCGISGENIERIFQPFFTTKPTHANRDSDQPTGTGLGLSNCIDLMKAYEARFKVISEPQKGTRIIWEIPCRQSGFEARHSATELAGHNIRESVQS
ncbi:MAG: HAMP domain-containing sensor histidine kinase [Candidatus Auribacterota bacterium]|jgi:signal transduction histidine kinase|nr:HAMP domain-containing sensor histidine kinase [Candidatus Auribacterota bacterium]